MTPRHPDIYGAVFWASPGAGYRPPAVMPSSLPRAYLVAGTATRSGVKNSADGGLGFRTLSTATPKSPCKQLLEGRVLADRIEVGIAFKEQAGPL
jgi:hypothetical protein